MISVWACARRAAWGPTTCARSWRRGSPRGRSGFTLEAQIAAPDDDPNDPSRNWPESRERVTVGTLELDTLLPDQEADGGIVVFDPTRVTDGIELSDDPVLLFRAKAYSASVERRAG